MNDEHKKKGKVNVYVLVFGILAAIIIIAALSVTVFNKASAPALKNSTSANLSTYGPAPQLVGLDGWINSPPLNLTSLRGNVVLVDFWTYSCINCIRSIPHLNAWEQEYGSNGLVIIGISTPEFQFEHNYTNVYDAVKKFNITYPVALDNNYGTWDAYGNEYWPADYLIDAKGNIRYVAFGEGDYNQTEQAIRTLLVQSGHPVPSYTTNVPIGINFSGIGTPEIYLGSVQATERGQPLGGGEQLKSNNTYTYYPINVSMVNKPYLYGAWYDAPDSIIAYNGSKVYLIYKANKVNIVASGNGNTTNITIKLDGKNLNASELGADDVLVNGTATATISGSRLYNIVDLPTYGAHLVEIDANQGFRLYTFTFG
jgi:thiol-disulfide isomerase/thioredoxin